MRAHLLLLPVPVSLALQACERAREAVTLKRYDDPTVLEAVSAVRGLAAAVETGVLAQVDVEAEIAESRRFLGGFLLPTDNPPDLAARGQRILDRLEQADAASMHGRVVVLDGPSLEAFGRGGENLFIGQDVLDLPEDEGAAIIAHERAHMLERHMTKVYVCADVTREMTVQAGLSPTEASPVKRLGELAGAALQREQEFVADAMACRALERAGYDRDALRRVLERLGPTSPEAARPADDHPRLSERQAALARWSQ